MELQPFVHLPTKKQAMEYLIIRWGGGEGEGGGGVKGRNKQNKIKIKPFFFLV